MSGSEPSSCLIACSWDSTPSSIIHEIVGKTDEKLLSILAQINTRLRTAVALERQRRFLDDLRHPVRLIDVCGSFDELQVAVHQGLADRRACNLAARSGNLEMLQWCHELGLPWDHTTCAAAAKNGHLHMLQYARSHGCPWDKLTCSEAAGAGNFEILQWAHAAGCQWDACTCAAAIRKGHPEIAQWARSQGCPPPAPRYKRGQSSLSHQNDGNSPAINLSMPILNILE